MKKILLLTTILLLTFSIVSSNENYPAGARSLGLSHSSVSFSDTWSTFHNQAGIGNISNITSGFFYESKFQIDELSLIAGSLILPVKGGGFGLSFFQFGKGLYKENKIGLAFAKPLGDKVTAGIQLDYFAQTFPENERSKGFVTAEGGIIYQPLDDLSIGAHIFNPVSAGIKTAFGKIELPATIRLGTHYSFDESVLITAEAEKHFHNPLIIKTGIEYLPVKNLALRIGVSGKPTRFTSGIGYRTGKISTDIAFSYHGNLGITPSISIQFIL